jgi:hypothetical protein
MAFYSLIRKNKKGNTTFFTRQLTSSPVRKLWNSPARQFTNSPVVKLTSSPVRQFASCGTRQLTNSPVRQLFS